MIFFKMAEKKRQNKKSLLFILQISRTRLYSTKINYLGQMSYKLVLHLKLPQKIDVVKSVAVKKRPFTKTIVLNK